MGFAMANLKGPMGERNEKLCIHHQFLGATDHQTGDVPGAQGALVKTSDRPQSTHKEALEDGIGLAIESSPNAQFTVQGQTVLLGQGVVVLVLSARSDVMRHTSNRVIRISTRQNTTRWRHHRVPGVS